MQGDQLGDVAETHSFQPGCGKAVEYKAVAVEIEIQTWLCWGSSNLGLRAVLAKCSRGQGI